MSFQALLRECDEHIRQGRDEKAHRLLRELEISKLPRSLQRDFANLCRRSGLLSQGLRILTPLVREEIASEAERAEYAMLLQRSGAVTEALGVLQKLDPQKDPQILLFQAFCHFNEWNYEAALPLLHRYLEFPLADYPRLIARVNLVACLLTLHQWEAAAHEIERAFAEAENAGRLRGNLHELRAQWHLGRGRFSDARKDLVQAQAILGGIQNEDLLFVRKWNAVIDLKEKTESDAMKIVLRDAEKASDWETAREARLFLLTDHFDHDAYLELLVGTPFTGYRARIQSRLDRTDLPELPSRWRWGAPDSAALDLATGELHGMTRTVRPPTAKCLQLIEALSQDLFRPQRLATLFGRLFPREHFDIFSSPQRVHQILRRTRRWLSENDLPLQIEESGGQFRLRKPDRFALILTLSREPRDNQRRLLQRLERDFGTEPYFTGPEAAARLGISESLMKRVLAWGVAQKRLRRQGRGSGTTYSLDVA
ncbi:MAG: hypothetical protein KF767_00075 [Bdellovibrionaceae bacterium]|nr:hypothetical protein [Pseudobdellovibrionaceae bacterium]